MDLSGEKARVLKRDAEWAALASEGRDIEGILSFWTDDAVVMPPALRVVLGKAALRAYVLGSFQIPGFSISWSTSDAVVSADATFAYLLSQNAVTMNGPDGSPTKLEGRAVTIWRKDADGEWRCAVDIWNGGPLA